MLVHQILKSKGDDGVVTVTPETSIRDVASVLAKRKIGTVVVSDDGRKALGILSERDIVRELAKGGESALAAMRDRGSAWLNLSHAIEHVAVVDQPAAPRPSPAPPVSVRPSRLSVTQIKTLVRDPYAVYANKVLGLSPLDGLRPRADARLRGILLHRVFEMFVQVIYIFHKPAIHGTAYADIINHGQVLHIFT